LADTAGATDGALQIKGHGFDITAPKDVVEVIVRGWLDTLQWGGLHPYLFVCCLAFLLLLAVIIVRGSVEKNRDKIAYRTHIEANKIPQLPLPKPDEKVKG
jgi:hypothetical protein